MKKQPYRKPIVNKTPSPTPKIAAHIINRVMMDLAVSSQLLSDAEEKARGTMFEFKYPQVMGTDGKATTADKVQQSVRFTDNLIGDSSPVNNVGGGLYGFNSFYFNKLNSLLIDNVFLGYAEYSLLLQNGICNSICNTPATEMTREWIEFISVSDQDKTERIKELELEFERLNAKDLFQRAAYLTIAMGGCLMYPKIKGDEKGDELQQAIPDNVEEYKIGIGDLEYITIVEPIWYVPIRYVTDNPLSKWFYVPEFWTVMGKIVHTSRVFHFMYNEAPNIIKPQYNFNGMPLLQQSLKYIMNFETMTNTIIEIVGRLNLTVIKTNLQSIINGAAAQDPNTNSNAGANLGTRIRQLNATRNNLGTMAIDMDNEDILNLTMTLTGLDKLWSQAAEFMCIVPQQPATELLGISPQGFNASGEYERLKWNRKVKTFQEKIFRPHLVKLMHMAMCNIWGKVDEDITFEFKNLAEANQLEESQIAVNEMQEATGYVAAGVVSPNSVKTKLMTDKDSGWNGLEMVENGEENEQTEYQPPTENLSGGNYGGYVKPKTQNAPINAGTSANFMDMMTDEKVGIFIRFFKKYLK